MFGSEDDGVRIANDFYVEAAIHHARLRGTAECTPFGSWFPCDIEYDVSGSQVRQLVHRTTKEVMFTFCPVRAARSYRDVYM